MEDVAFEVLDELYFVTPYAELKNALGFEDITLKNALIELVKKDWVLVFKNMEDEIQSFDLENNFKTYCYLASKKGLLAHNSL